jgi:hypothetical protein
VVFEVVFWGISGETQKGRLGVSSSQECSHFGLMGCLRAVRGDHVGREADGPTGCATCMTFRHRHFRLSRLIETVEF